jgi:hypothetical protein
MPTDTQIPLNVNSHIHLPPNFSAFRSVDDALDCAAAEGIGVLGVSNYYDFTVYSAFIRDAQARGIFPLAGLEIIALDPELQASGTKVNDPGNPGRFYICGKAITRFDPIDPDAVDTLGWIRESDTARMATMVEKIEAICVAAGHATGLGTHQIRASVADAAGCALDTVVLQERHVAQAFADVLAVRAGESTITEILTAVCGATVAATDPAGQQNALRSHLMKAGKPAYVPERFVDFDQAFALILALGGVPTYPTLADGANPVCPFEAGPATLVAELKRRGIHAAELIPIRNTPEVLSTFVKAFRSAGLVVTAGTEHNTPDRIPVLPRCVGGAPIPGDIAEIFREGALVMAGHQTLVSQGRSGYVLRDGSLNPEYPDQETRIAALRAVGERAVAQMSGR